MQRQRLDRRRDAASFKNVGAVAGSQYPGAVGAHLQSQSTSATNGLALRRLCQSVERAPVAGARRAPCQRHESGGDRDNHDHHQQFKQRQSRSGMGQEGTHRASISEAFGGSQQQQPPPGASNHFLISGLTASGTSNAVAGAPLISTFVTVMTNLLAPIVTSVLVGNFTPPKSL